MPRRRKPPQRRLRLRPPLHGDAGREGHEVDPRRADAGVRPVDHEDLARSQEEVVGANIKMEERVALDRRRGPRFEGSKGREMATRPGVQAITRCLMKLPPAVDVRREVRTDSCGRDRGG